MNEPKTQFSQFPQITPAGPTPTVPVSGKTGLIIKIVAGVVVAGIIGGGVCLAARIWDPLWNPFRPEPEEVIEGMADKMREVKTGHSEIKIGIEVIDEKTEGKIQITLSGDSDNTDPENPKSVVDFDIVVSVEGMSFSLAGKTKTIGETSFVKLTTIPALPFLQPYLAMLGIDLSKIKNQWIEYDQESLKSILGKMYTPEMEEQLQKQKEKQEEMIKKIESVFENKKLYSVKKEFPDEKINNVKTYHYLVALDNEELKKVISELSDILGDGLGLGEARIKAKKAIVMTYMAQMRSMAEIIYTDEGYSYANVSCQNKEIKPICDGIKEEVGTEPIIYQSGEQFCAYAFLPVEGYYYCIDSDFNGVTTNIFPENPGYCNGITFVCPEGTTISDKDIKKAGKEELSKGLDEFFEKVGEIAGELWIGKKDNLLYKVKIDKEIDMSQLTEDAGRGIAISVEIWFSNFNEPVKIEAPEKSKSLEEIFNEKETFLSPFIESQQRAAEAAIKANMAQMRAAAEIIYMNEGYSYANVSCLNPEMEGLCSVIKENAGMEPVIYQSDQDYCAYVKLLVQEAGKTRYWCIDSKGHSVETTINPGESGYCDGVTFTCLSQ